MKRLTFIIGMLVATTAQSQQGIRFEVMFSKPLAVLQFVQSLRPRAQQNQYKTLFMSSEFNTPKYSALIAAFDSLPLDYEYDFPEYPAGQKIGGSTMYTLRRNLVLSKDLDEFRDRSIGLIPLIDLTRATSILKEFTPVYDKVVYDSTRTNFEWQLKSIDSLMTARDMARLFTQAGEFYRSQWDSSIPFLFVFYPLPNARGFQATAFGNVSMSALPTSYTDFTAILTVMLHESAHVLFDEESLAFKNQLDDWFKSNPSRYSIAAYHLLNESWATAVTNGYFREKMVGTLNPGSWYGRKYTDSMAKAMYPFIKDCLESGKPMDKELVDRQVATYESKFPGWIYEWENLMGGRTVMSDNPSDFDIIDRKFPYRNAQLYLHDFSSDSFEKLLHPGTKFIVVHNDNKRKIDLIKAHFPSLADWKPDYRKDFSVAHMLPDKNQLVIINLVKTTLEQHFDLPIAQPPN